MAVGGDGRPQGSPLRGQKGGEGDGSPHARGHGTGGGWVPAMRRGDGFLLPCSLGQALRGNNGWGGRFVAFGMTFGCGRGRATTRVAPTGAEGRGGGWVPAEDTGGDEGDGFLLPCSRKGRLFVGTTGMGWALRCRNDIWRGRGRATQGSPLREQGTPHARGHGRGTRGMGSCSHVHEGRLFVGKTGGVDAAFGMTFGRRGWRWRGRAGLKPAPTYC